MGAVRVREGRGLRVVGGGGEGGVKKKKMSLGNLVNWNERDRKKD